MFIIKLCKKNKNGYLINFNISPKGIKANNQVNIIVYLFI